MCFFLIVLVNCGLYYRIKYGAWIYGKRRIKLPLYKEKSPKVPAKFNFFEVPDIVSWVLHIYASEINRPFQEFREKKF